MSVTAAKSDPIESPLPPQAPVVGRWRGILGRFHFTGSFWYRFHLFGVRVLPSFLIAPVVWLMGTGFFLALGSVRRAVGRNLEAVLGPCGWFERQRRAYRTMLEFSTSLTERYELFVPDRPFEPIYDGIERWEELLAGPRGFLVVTAHVGNWEVVSTLSTQCYDCTVHLVREGEIDAESQEFVRQLVEGVGGSSYHTHFAASDFGLGVRLMRAIERGEIVALQGDRPRTGGQTVRGTIFGRPIDLPVGPAALARSSNAPILPVFVERVGRRRYRIAFRPPIRVERTRDRHGDHRRAMQRFASEVEAAIRTTPYQWFCFRDLWPASSGTE